MKMASHSASPQTASPGAESPKALSPKVGASIRTPRLERGKARVSALMAAGAAVFAEKGYDAATMTEIAARAGAAIGSLYQFFPTKELLAAALHASLLAELSERLDLLCTTAAGRTAAELADALFADLFAFLTTHPALVALADRRDIDKARKRASRAQLLGQIATLLSRATPPLPDGQPEILAVVILQLMKAAISLSQDSDWPDATLRPKVQAELRQMLQAHLAGG